MNFLKKIFVSCEHFFQNYTPAVVKKYNLPILSGILFGIGFIPFPVFTMFFALVPLWFFLYNQTQLKSIVIGSWITQFITTLIGFNWIIYTAHTFGELNWLVSFLVLMLFCAFANIFITLSSIIWFFLIKDKKISPTVKVLLLPILFSLFHILIPTIFPWNMGYPWLWANLPAAQTAELWGFRFLNTLFYIFNVLILIFYKHRWDSIGKWALSIFVGILLFLNGLGFYLQKKWMQPDASLKAIVIQNNIGSLRSLKNERFKGNPRQQSLYRAKNLTIKSYLKFHRKNRDVNFILWPEGSYPYVINKNQNQMRGLSRLIKKMKIPLITGGITRDSKGYSNSLIVLDRQGQIMKPIYDKVKLLAFGETFPGAQTFPFLLKWFSYFGVSMNPGKKHQVKNLEGVSLGFQICYESLFDRHSRNLALDGAQILVNITNDSWYTDWQEPLQHLVMTFGRAIETRRPLIRSTNTGLSALIHADGTVQTISPRNKSWNFLYKIPYYKQAPQTLFMKWGFYINEIFLFLFAFFILTVQFIYQRKNK